MSKTIYGQQLKYLSALLRVSKRFEHVTILFSGDQATHYPLNGDFSIVCALGVKKRSTSETSAFSKLDHFLKDKWSFGHLSYDLKAQLAELPSANDAFFNVPAFAFTQPEHLLVFNSQLDLITCESPKSKSWWLQQLDKPETTECITTAKPLLLKPNFSKDDYLKQVRAIQELIVAGDVYEMNFCQLFEAEVDLNPYNTFHLLAQELGNPFCAFVKCKDQYTLCSSMERFLKRKGETVYSQPIKGTKARSGIADDDEIQDLVNDPKETAENLMIVDLVRNDLNKHANIGSVEVPELFGVYSFPGVHQMISTVKATVPNSIGFTQIIEDTFPMGSMTGAPKRNAMRYIESMESFRRGLFSGAIGYIMPNGDFDFNVVIRTAFYQQATGKLHIPVGSAITIDSDPESEYNECLQKIGKLQKVLAQAIF